MNADDDMEMDLMELNMSTKRNHVSGANVGSSGGGGGGGSSITPLDLPCMEAARCYVTEIELGMRLSPVQQQVVEAASDKDNNNNNNNDKNKTRSLSSPTNPTSLFKGFTEGIGRRISSIKNNNTENGGDSAVSNDTTAGSSSSCVTLTKQRRINEEWYVSVETSYVSPYAKTRTRRQRQRRSHTRRRQGRHVVVDRPVRTLQLRNCNSGEYLCSTSDGKVSTCLAPDETTRWIMMTQQHYEEEQEQQWQQQLLVEEEEPDQPQRRRRSSRQSRMRTSSSSEWSMSTSSSSSGSFSLSDSDVDDDHDNDIEDTFNDEYEEDDHVYHMSATDVSVGKRLVLVSQHHSGQRLVYSSATEPSTSTTSGSVSNGSRPVSSNDLILSTAQENKTSNRTKINQSSTCVLELEFTSGELCFISNPVFHCQMRCNLLGQLNMVHTNKKGWEVFRFIDIPGTDNVDTNHDANDENRVVANGDVVSSKGGSQVAISSWVHHQYFLSSNSDGDVFMISNGSSRSNVTERWRILPCSSSSLSTSPSKNRGVYIQSVAHGRYLSVGRHQKEALSTTIKPNDYALWHLDAAHSYIYYITSLITPSELEVAKHHDVSIVSNADHEHQQGNDGLVKSKRLSYSMQGLTSTISSSLSKIIPPDLRISSSQRGPFLTKNKRSWEEWKIERITMPSSNDDTFHHRQEGEYVTFFSKAHEKYLGCNSSGQVHTTTSRGSWCHWEMKQSPFGGVMFRSVEHNRLLAVNVDGTLFTTPVENSSTTDDDDDDDGDGDGDDDECESDSPVEIGIQHSWRLDPRLPHATSANKVAILSAVGVAGIALTVAMPFAVLGVVEAIGVSATELGIGLSAEALAGAGVGAAIGVGALGTTAKIVDNKDETDRQNVLTGSPTPSHDPLSAKANDAITPSPPTSSPYTQTASNGMSLEEYSCKKCRPLSSWRSW